MRRDFLTQSAAQAFADAIHARMIADDADYAASVKAGHTKAWAIPYQDADAAGSPAGPWWVNVKERVRKVLRSDESIELKPFRSQFK